MEEHEARPIRLHWNDYSECKSETRHHSSMAPPQRKKKNHPGSWNVLPIGTSRSNESRQARPRVLLFIGHKKGIHSREKGLLTKVPFTCSLIARKKERIEGSERKREGLREGQKKTFRHGWRLFHPSPPIQLYSSSNKWKCAHALQPDAAAIKILTLKMGSLRGNKVPSREQIFRINFSCAWFLYFAANDVYPVMCIRKRQYSRKLIWADAQRWTAGRTEVGRGGVGGARGWSWLTIDGLLCKQQTRQCDHLI